MTATTTLGPSAHVDTFARDNLPPPGQWPDFLLDGFDYPETLNCAVELTDRMVEKGFGDRTALIGNGRRRTYKELADVLNTTLARDTGNVIIPAFAVGRTQEMLFVLADLVRSGRVSRLDVAVDSPMATAATELTVRHRELWDDETRELYDWVQANGERFRLRFVQDVEESIALNAVRGGRVIISASGMATGGRVLHHLKSFATDPKHTILFSGYQSAGTRGRAMVQGAREIRIHGQWVPVRAEIDDLSTLSAHADADELMRWLAGFQRGPSRVFIVHGEDEGSEALRVRIDRELGWDATVPRQGQVFDL